MSATLRPFGLKPAFHPSGTLRLDEAFVASGYASNIYAGSPVRFAVGGGLVLAAATELIAGVFGGVQFTRPDGTIFVGPYWPAGSVYVPGTCKAVLQTTLGDTSAIFEVQASATLTELAIGKVYDTTANASANGNLATGISDVQLNAASSAGPGTQQLMVVGLSKAPDNEWGDAFPVVLVKLAKPQFGASFAALY
jgi:hypothetical protein